MYLHRTMEDIAGNSYPMVEIIEGEVHKTNSLKRFGYIVLKSNHNQMIADFGERICGHEFHYFESSLCGESFTAHKPLRKIEWNCIHGNEHLAVDFPHLYYYSNINIPYKFLKSCVERRKANGKINYDTGNYV